MRAGWELQMLVLQMKLVLRRWEERNGSCAFFISLYISLVLVYILYEMWLGFSGTPCPTLQVLVLASTPYLKNNYMQGMCFQL